MCNSNCIDYSELPAIGTNDINPWVRICGVRPDVIGRTVVDKTAQNCGLGWALGVIGLGSSKALTSKGRPTATRRLLKALNGKYEYRLY